MSDTALDKRFKLISFLTFISFELYRSLRRQLGCQLLCSSCQMRKSQTDNILRFYFLASILYKSIVGRYRPVRYPDGPITVRYRFTKNAYWVTLQMNRVTAFPTRVLVRQAKSQICLHICAVWSVRWALCGVAKDPKRLQGERRLVSLLICADAIL